VHPQAKVRSKELSNQQRRIQSSTESKWRRHPASCYWRRTSGGARRGQPLGSVGLRKRPTLEGAPLKLHWGGDFAIHP